MQVFIIAELLTETSEFCYLDQQFVKIRSPYAHSEGGNVTKGNGKKVSARMRKSIQQYSGPHADNSSKYSHRSYAFSSSFDKNSDLDLVFAISAESFW